jgi:N-methylhydantoinase B
VAIVLFSHIDPSTGGYKVSVLQPMQGGSGGRPTKDGIDGVNFSAGTLRNVPTEAIELEAPVFVNRYMLVEDAAPGEHRGGTGVELQFTCLAAEAIVTARGMDRFMLRPYGRIGGVAGALGRCTLDPGTPDARENGKIDRLELERGDVVRIVSPGGGGFGPAMRRDPAKVLTDVANGLLTVAAAESHYGVIVANGAVDTAATSAARAAAPADTAEFVFGPERTGYETTLPGAVQDLVARLLASRPSAVRFFARGRIYGLLSRQPNLLKQDTAALEAALSTELDHVLRADVAAMA